MDKKTFLIDVDRCSGCALCIVACKDEHVENEHLPWAAPQPVAGHFWMNVLRRERGRLPRVRMSYLPLLCQHCENAPCIKGCSAGAIKRRADGLVWIDPALCNGCGDCQEACPYDVIYINEDLNIAQKCTGCAHLVDEGKTPRCADVCPHDAIMFGDEAAREAASGSGKATEIFHPEYETRPLVSWRGLPRPWIAGLVLDAETDEVIVGAEIVSVDLFDDSRHTAQSDAFGDFWIRGLQSDRKYVVTVREAGYEELRTVVTTRGDQDLGTIALNKLARSPSTA